MLVQGGADARYVETGHLVYIKAGTLMAVPFDLRSQQITGSPVAVLEGVMQSVNTPNALDETAPASSPCRGREPCSICRAA